MWQVNIKIWQVNIKIWQDDIKIWQVNIIIWQVMAEVCHHTFERKIHVYFIYLTSIRRYLIWLRFCILFVFVLFFRWGEGYWDSFSFKKVIENELFYHIYDLYYNFRKGRVKEIPCYMHSEKGMKFSTFYYKWVIENIKYLYEL